MDEEVGVGKTEGAEKKALEVLEAKQVYILMSKDHRISRNRRAEWFFSRFDCLVTLLKDAELNSVGESVDFHVVSAIPKNPPLEWTPERRHCYQYKVTTNTVVTYLSRRYRIVYCIDVSPSVGAVDVQAGTVVFDRIFQSLKCSLDGLMRPFVIPGSTAIFQPKIFITVITHSPFIATVDDEVILQGKLLGPSTYNDILKKCFERLNCIENKMAEMASTLLHNLDHSMNCNPRLQSELEGPASVNKTSISISSDRSLVDLLKQALIGLSLLPENSSSGLVILTDGVISVPDGRYLDNILSQLRYNTVSCSFIQLSSAFHPHLCHSALPYADLMRFIASATCGAFLSEAPDVAHTSVAEMNVYHTAFLAWSFQNSDSSQVDYPTHAVAKPGEWSIRNKCFFSVRDMPIVKKQQYSYVLDVDYMKVLSCRLREGFMIKNIQQCGDGDYEITLSLPWKFLIHLEYVIVTLQTPDAKVECTLHLEGPYDFLHDVTCLAGRAFTSFYRQLMVNRFWATRKTLAESDRLLVHLNSFSSNPAYYSIPDSLRNGVPLFYFSSNSTIPLLQSSEFPYPQFAQFWKPVCMLDTTVWQKWMHTHRIGIILEHDHPLPKHLHFPNSTGRFHIVQCRQAVMALNTLLKNMSSFVLVENHSYVTLMYEGENTTPFSFYIIRVTSKPPYVVLRLAFLVGTPGNLRHKAVSDLRQKISELTFPQRLKEPPRWRIASSIHSNNTNEQSTKTTWSEMLCCLLVHKPIEKILIRYEKIPDNFCEVLMAQHPFESPADTKSFGLKQSTFGFRPTHPNSLTSTSVMVPEMFNTVARYLHIKRWIWWFPKSVLVNFGLKEAAEIVSTITKMRLQEGFRFAYSSGGTITMVLEVQMENETCRSVQELSEILEQSTSSQKYNTPCVVQFVVFPPCTSLTVNDEGDDEAYEDSENLYFVTECWSEPQCGKIATCPFRLLNGLEFSDVPSKVFEVNQECFKTLGTYEFLRGATDIQSRVAQKIEEQRKVAIQKGVSLTDKNIELIPFEFDLERILPKCQQAEIFFSMFFQDLSVAFTLDKEDHFVPFHERANGNLYNTWSINLAEVHDKEIKLEMKHYEGILRMIISRDEEISKQYSEFQKVLSDKVPAWRCFVRAVDSSQIFITLIPRTLRDTKELFLCLEKSRCFQNLPDPNSQFDNLYNAFNSEESMDSIIKPKTRSRKISEPNCAHKPASTSLAASLALEIACPLGVRKRVRAFSGGESAAVLKKALNIRSKLEEITTRQVIDESLLKYIVPKDHREIIVEDFANEDMCAASEDSMASEPSPVHGNQMKVGHIRTDSSNASNSFSHSVVGSLSLPVYMYSCSLSGLKDHLILKGSSEILDSFLDFRIFRVEGECERFFGHCNEMESPSRSSDCASQETKASAHGSSDIQKMSIEEYCKELQLAYKIAYVRSVFESLQSGYHVGVEDLKAIVNFCHKDIVPIDITEFIKCVVSIDFNSEETEKLGVESIPNFIQRKFQNIICKDFQYVDPSMNLLFFKIDQPVKQENYTQADVEEISVEKEDVFDASSLDGQFPTHDTYNRVPEGADGNRRCSEDIQRASAFPLFMYIVCTFDDGDIKESVMVSELPLSLDAPEFENIRQIIKESDLPLSWNMKLELVLLSSPVKDLSSKNDSAFSAESRREEIQREENSTTRATLSWPKLPTNQETAVKNAVNEIHWLLDDEITSFRSKSNVLTVDILRSIADHVEKSPGKLGCFQQMIPLKFLNESREQAYKNFVERFNSLKINGYCLRKMENWWYLAYEDNGCVEGLANAESSEYIENKDLRSSQDMHVSDQDASSLLELSQLSDFSYDNHGTTTAFPFWMIFQIEMDRVISYCHCRYNEKDLAPLRRCHATRDLMLNAISDLIRIVNQDLLLQLLHDTRMCSPLLEPENIPDPNEDFLSAMALFDFSTRTESDFEGFSSHTRAGMFSCNVVWETRFRLHSRLRSGPGKSAFSRGVQILRSTLIALEVTNRENMFVYRNSKGDVFYLRLYRVYDDLDGMEYDINSENPSPRSSVSSRSRAHELAERISRDEMLTSMRENSTPRDRGSEGIILLKVHGITEAGTEIKEQLIASLKNKLDDAILDVLSITLDRNPHCKLTPEDVHFIQKPNSQPDAIFKFSTRKFTRLLLPAFAYYLHQNLLQFLNIPKYTRPEFELHFQDYFQRQNNFSSEDQNVYLYNQNPGETGSRGVACVSASLIDKTGAQIRSTDWKTPADLFFSAAIETLSSLIETEEVINDAQETDVMIQLCVWKQGRVNLEILKNMFCSAIKYAGWDLAMEYQILTPPLKLTDSHELSPELVALGEIHGSRRTQSSAGEIPGRSGRRRNSSSVSTKEIKASTKDQPRNRSLSFTMRRDGTHVVERARYRKGSSPNSPNLKRGGKSYDSVRNAEFLSSKRTKIDRYENLHSNYTTLLKRWCSIGSKLNTPSLRVVNFDFKQSHYLDETLMEIGKIINTVAPDSSIFQFWKLQEVTREFLAVGEKIRPDCSELVKKIRNEVNSFKINEDDLSCLEMKDEAEYPEHLLELFKTKEYFEPSRPKDLCVMVARNVHHWRNCGSTHVLDPTLSSPEVYQNMLKFAPLISDSNFPKDDRSSYSLDRSRFNVPKGLLSLLEESATDYSSILIPRQRFFMATVTKSSIEMILYNWSKESSDRIVEQAKVLSEWVHARMQLLSSVLLQKSGLFYLQPFFFNNQSSDSSENNFGVPDIRDLVLNSTPVKGSILDRLAGRKLSFSKTTAQLNDLYRNLYHVHTQKLSDEVLSAPVKTHGEQTLCLLNSGKKEIENALFRYWLSRGPSASNVIGVEAIEAFKQAARTIHYCMSPIMFNPRWRNEVALTRDSTFGIYKRRRPSYENAKGHQDALRSRHVSEASAQSRGSMKSRNVMWSIWRRSHQMLGSLDDESVLNMTMQSLLNMSKKTEEPWHVSLCNIFIQEYMQYLQTLGYIPTHSNTGSLKQKSNLLTSETWKESYAGRMERVRRMSDGSVLSAESDRTSLRSYISAKSDNISPKSKEKVESDDRTYYLQKSLPGGIILLEVGLSEPFCYCKIHALEAHRIQQNASYKRSTSLQSSQEFINECDRMKVAMHLHSFAYDFHLRCLHSYVSGRQLIFKHGYHITKFLEDFNNYYCKGPNFARNTIHFGIINMPEITIPASILFDYILSHEQSYEMKVIRMNQLHNNKPVEIVDTTVTNDFVLVYSLHKKVAYRESGEESHYEEFDIALITSNDTTPPEGSVFSSDLHIKYYILLTSRRELYPKIFGESNGTTGKFYPVSVPETVSSNQYHKLSRQHSVQLSSSFGTSSNVSDITLKSSPTTSSFLKDFRPSHDSHKTEKSIHGIREEKVLFMGYFSNHEQMMQQIVTEQSEWAEKFIKKIIGKAAVDCRRDLLWQRLLISEKGLEKGKPPKEPKPVRETVGGLTFQEFSELLELVFVEPIQALDSRVQTLLQYPTPLFQNLIRVLASECGDQYQYKYFVSPDQSVHRLAIMNPEVYKTVVLIEMNSRKYSCNLRIVFKEAQEKRSDTFDPSQLVPQIRKLVEIVISACCYCDWTNFI